MLADRFASIENSDPTDGLVDAKPPADEFFWGRNGIAIRVECDVALDIDVALVNVVDFGNVDRQRPQRRFLGYPKGSWGRAEMTSELEVCVVTPGSELFVAVLDVLERTPLVEVVLNVVERALDSPRAIRVTHGMGLEAKVKAVSERLHHGRGKCIFSAALTDDDRAVVDHAARCAPSEVLERLGEEGAALEPGPALIYLGVHEAAVAEDEASALQLALLSPERDLVR